MATATVTAKGPKQTSATATLATKAEHSPSRKLFNQIFSGFVAGSTELIIMYPLDVAKTRAQLAVGSQRGPGLISTLAKAAREEGFAVYRGIGSVLTAEGPKRAMKFTSNEQFKNFFATTRSDGTKLVTQSTATYAGILSGISEAFIITPFEHVKIRMQQKGSSALYKNSADCLKQINRGYGPLMVYRGLEATCWRHGAWNGGYFSVIFSIRQYVSNGQVSKDPLTNLAIGTAGGIFATAVNTPFDVAKSRIQSSPLDKKVGWTVPKVFEIGRAEGLAALYKGFVPKVARLGPGGGIMLVVFDAVMSFLDRF
eukprot:Clim_evm44s253 gene=Clim_evmTU44s253